MKIVVVFVLILAASVFIIFLATWNFNRIINQEVKSLLADINQDKEITTHEMLDGLPEPVKNWLANSGIIGREKIYAVHLCQKGLIKLRPAQINWIKTTAEQYFTINPPAFIWKVKMDMMPLLPVAGRDKFVDGKGRMTIKLFSLINVANEAGDKINQAALQRWLAEICWFPSAALSPYIKWETIDSTAAKATVTYENISGSVIFRFNKQGDIESCTADRYKENAKDAPLEKWQVDTIKYGVMNGIRIPVESEVTWKLKDGDFTWYKLEITAIDYNKLANYR